MGRRRRVAVAAIAACVVIGTSAGPAAAETHGHKLGETLFRDGFPPERDFEDHFLYREQTGDGGAVVVSNDFGGPPGNGSQALKLTTPNDADAVAQLFNYHHVYGVALSSLSTLTYWTYQATGTPADGNAALHLKVDIDGDLSTHDDETELVYEPHLNDTEGSDPQQPIAPNTWQFWDTLGGGWWTTRKITCGTFEVEAGDGGAPFTTPATVAANCTSARLVAWGPSVGPSDADHVVGFDGVHFVTAIDDVTFDYAPK
jgi:hypothetical protein